MRIMSDLKSDQLDAIHRLLVEPLRETIRQELRLSHQRLASTIEKLDERVAGRIADHDRRLMAVERTTSQFRAFRGRILAVYGE
jgi:hypothetical protein